MTNRYLNILRTVFVATAVAALVLVPVTGALGVGKSIDDRDTNTLRLKDETQGRASDDDTQVHPLRTYGRANYVWPFATGPKYGTTADVDAPGVVITPAGTFQLREELSIAQPLRTSYKLDHSAAQYFIVQFDGDGYDGDLVQAEIEASGAKVVSYMGNASFVVRVSADSFNAVSSAIGVVTVEPYHAGFKLNPAIGRTPLPDPIKATSDVYALDVVLWRGEDPIAAADALRALGGNVTQIHRDQIRVEISRNQLADVAALEPVQVVFEHLPHATLAEETTTTMQTGQYNAGAIPYHDAGIDGGGGTTGDVQVLMVLDSGISLDAGDLSDERADAGSPGIGHRKVRVYESTNQFGGSGDILGCDAPAQGGFSHGHVVSATAVGNATDVDVSYNGLGWNAFDQQGNPWNLDGVAPAALLVAYDAQVTPPNGSCSDPLLDSITPGDLYNSGAAGACPGLDCPGSLGVSYVDEDARVVNFSWGAQSNTYSANALDIDTFILDKEDAMVFVSAGNAGADNIPASGDGIPDEGTLGTPATTKNGMAVGASRNANTVNSPESREFFSSMGPAIDVTTNRIAPQVMAPGGEPGGGTLGVSSEFSCRSNDNDQSNPVTCDIITGIEGTSFSSPAAAGAALIVRDYFRQGFYPDGRANPGDEVTTISGALLKAMLIASTDWMTGVNLTRTWRPNNEQGYGRIQLDNVLPLELWPASPSGLVVHDAGLTGGGPSNLGLPLGISNGDNVTTTFTVCNDDEPLSIVLAYTDMVSATGALLNDIDIEVTSPSGIRYRGNYTSDDDDRDGVPETNEDCGGIGALDVEVPNGLIDASEWSLPVCALSSLPGKNGVARPFDNANPTEAIFLSNDPEGDDDPDGSDPGTGGLEGLCDALSELNANGPCDNNLDCRNSPAGVGTCVNPDDYKQTEFGEWTLRVKETGATTGSQKYAIAIAGGVCLGSSARFDDGTYTCNESATISISEIEDGPMDTSPGAGEATARTTLQVLENGIVVDTETGIGFTQPNMDNLSFLSEPITLTDGTGRQSGNGVLDVRSGDQIRIVYQDIDPDTGAAGAVRTNVAAVNCKPEIGFGSITFAQYGQDSQVLVQGGCERNARGYFEFGFPDRYMDADEVLIYNFAFNSNETVDLDQVEASLACVIADADSPADCLPNGAGCADTDDPERLNNERCDQFGGGTQYMTILGDTVGDLDGDNTDEAIQTIGFIPAGAAISSNFTLEMEPDGSFPATSPTIEMLLRVRAGTSGKTSTGLAFNRHKLNADELSTLYSTDFPTGGSEVVDAGPGAAGNNDEIASDPITEVGNFQTNDYRFETQIFGDLTAGGTRNQNLLSPWHFDGNDGNFSTGLAGPSDETAADVFNIANWGEDKNFNGIEDGVCLNLPGVACYNFGFNTDPRCGGGGTCSSVENNAGGTEFLQNWNMKGGCGWQTKPPNTCSGSTAAVPRGCFVTDDCAGSCQVVNNGVVSTFDACGTVAGVCPNANQCNGLSENPLAPCTASGDCDLSNDGGVFDTCDPVSQACIGDAGTCGADGAFATGGIWHTGAIGTTDLDCLGASNSQCANYKVITGTGGQLTWWELLATPVMEKVDQSDDAAGDPNSQAEIFDWAWNQALNLRDNNVSYTWELDTDTEALEPVDLFSDGTILNIGTGDYGAIADSNNPNLTRGFSVFAPIGTCRTEAMADTGRPCEVTLDCDTGLCSIDGTTACNFDIECSDAGLGTCLDEENCQVTAGGTTVNGSDPDGNNRVGQNGCFFEGAGTIPPTAQNFLGLAEPFDDDRDQDGNGTIDEFVTPNGPYRNHDIVAWNGPDMRFNTLEDLFGDTGNTFQAAIGFANFEGTPANQAQQSYGLGVDDMVVKWREFTLATDATDCTTGSCASIDLDTSNVFEGNTVIGIVLTEDSPSFPNDCDLDGNTDGTDDCDGNGIQDLVVKATSEAEVEGEIVFVNLRTGSSNQYSGNLTVSALGDTDPGILYISEQGGDNPTVTVTYDDDDDASGDANPICKNDVDPSKWGKVIGTTTVFLGPTCEVTIVGTEIDDNGDVDTFPDTEETVDMRVSYINNCGIDLTNCTARISTNSPNVECIINPIINLGDLEDNADTFVSSEAFTWKVGNVNRLTTAEDFAALFNVSISCDQIDALSVPQSVNLALDLDLNDLGQTPGTWTEDFESATLGKFVTENLDAGIPGNNDAEGLINGDGYRCQYSDPDWPNAGSYGDDAALDCYPGMNLAQADAVFWQVDGATIATSPDGGRAFSNNHSMYYGIFLTTPAGQFTTPLSIIESVRTSAPINLGVSGSILSYWHQISLVDDRALGAVPPLRSADRGVVQVQIAADDGQPAGVWTRLEPFQNAYDEQAVDNYFNCLFDPIDDGNTEDTFFDPTDPNRRTGPSSTCFPDLTFSFLGDTDEAFQVNNIGNADTPPAATDTPDLGVGTWVESRVDLSEYLGRRVRLRYLVTALKATQENWEDQFDINPDPRDDGWWIDGVNVSDTLDNAALLEVDDKTTNGCAGDPEVGCQSDGDCGGNGPCNQPAPACGATCNTVTVSLETEPDVDAAPLTELLPAPGQVIEVNAVTSSADRCLDGTLQYRFLENGAEARGWSDNPIFVSAPQSDVDLTVEVRCSSDTACTSSSVIDVNVNCPGGFPRLYGDLDGAGFSWYPNNVKPIGSGTPGPAQDYDLWSGALSGVSTYAGSAGTSGSGATGFDAVANPGPGTGTYYLTRTPGALFGPFCNSPSWSSLGQGETDTPGRDNTLP